jgi:hypothetical protein
MPQGQPRGPRPRALRPQHRGWCCPYQRRNRRARNGPVHQSRLSAWEIAKTPSVLLAPRTSPRDCTEAHPDPNSQLAAVQLLQKPRQHNAGSWSRGITPGARFSRTNLVRTFPRHVDFQVGQREFDALPGSGPRMRVSVLIGPHRGGFQALRTGQSRIRAVVSECRYPWTRT